MVIFFDIETYGPEPRGALNPIDGKIITIQVRWQGKNTIWKEWGRGMGEREIIRAFLDFLSDHRREPFVGDNLLKFDLPFLLCRLIHHEGEIHSPSRYLLIYQRRWIDLYQILLDSYVGLKDWAVKKVGLSSKITGKDIPRLYEKRQYRQIVSYINKELRSTEIVYNWVLQQRWYRELDMARREVAPEKGENLAFQPTLPRRVLKNLGKDDLTL